MVRRALSAVGFAALVLAGGTSAALLTGTPPTSPSTTLTTSPAETTYVITGHGDGHGMGMGQYGAYGYALHGWSDSQILEHYFTGTTIGQDPPEVVRVLLAEAVPQVTVASAAPWRVTDATGKKLKLPAGSLTLTAALKIRGHKLASPLTFTPGKAPVQVGRLAYRGSLTLSSDGPTLELVNALPLEAYVDGVVAGEMPPAWPRAALEAQAIAARSVALAAIQSTKPASSFDVYSDGRTQVYGGIAAETPATNAAVAATRGQVVLYQGQVVMTYYSASTGGQTTAVAGPGGDPIPYLVSVSDPYDTLSPDHDWGPILMSAVGAGKKLGLAGPLADLILPTAPGHVASGVAVGPGDDRVTLTGDQLQADLGLRSTFFQVAELELSPPPGAVAPGSNVILTGTILGLPGASLEARSPGGDWTIVAAVAPNVTGTFFAVVTPRATTQYRLATASAAGALIKVQVRAS